MYWRLLMLVTATLAYDWQQYDGYKLVNFWPHTKEQITAIKSLDDNNGASVWKEARVGQQADYFLSPAQYDQFTKAFGDLRITWTDSKVDVVSAMKDEMARLTARGYPDNMAYDPADFNTRIDIEGELDRLAGVCSTVGLTCASYFLPEVTVDGNQIKVLSIQGGNNVSNSIQWESGIHCREWISHATLMNIIDRMINGYGSDPESTFLINNYDFYMIPVMNPDGYDFTFSDDRFWRKNRLNNEDAACFGVDLNRNWDMNWSGEGASGQPCSDTYYGPSANSEQETRAVANHITSHTGPAFIMDVSCHSYGNYLLEPYGDGTSPSGIDGIRLAEVTDVGCAAIRRTFGTIWQCGNSAAVLYETSGGSTDWMMDTGAIKFTWVPELRGDGFVIPASEIPNSVEEMWNGLNAMVTTIHGYS